MYGPVKKAPYKAEYCKVHGGVVKVPVRSDKLKKPSMTMRGTGAATKGTKFSRAG